MKKIACRRFMELRIRKVDSTGTITTVAGYPSVLRTVHIPLITPEDCRENSFGTREIVHERTLCAGVEGKTCRPAGRCVGNVHVGGRQPEAVKQVQDEAVRAILEAFEKLRSFFYGCEYQPALDAEPQQVLRIYLSAVDHVFAQQDGWKRLSTLVKELSVAFALVVPRRETEKIVDHLAFFQRVAAII